MTVEWRTSEHGFDVSECHGAKLIVTTRRYFFVYREDKIIAWGRGNTQEDAKAMTIAEAERTRQLTLQSSEVES